MLGKRQAECQCRLQAGQGESWHLPGLASNGDTPQPHTTTGAAPIPKKLYCFKWQNVIGFCGAPGRAEGDMGWGWAPPVTKIKGFYKKGYKLVSKENPRGAARGSREGGGTRDQRVEDRQGSWDADTKCISGPPPTPQRRMGRGCGREAQPSPRQGPHWDGHCLRLPDGKDLQQREEKRLDGDRGDISPPCPGAPLRGPA